MLERLLLPEGHAISILLKDHDSVKTLFSRFEDTDSRSERERIIQEAVKELKLHAAIEEEIFYPAVRAHVGSHVMNEADEEHHVAKVLIAELEQQDAEKDHRDAKFQVLAESVRHHIKEEEDQMLPRAKEVDIDFIALGRRMLERKSELESHGVPLDQEHIMVGVVRGHSDSPAVKAQKSGSKTSARPAVKISHGVDLNGHARTNGETKTNGNGKTHAKVKTTSRHSR
jgi:hypothetical protein